MCYNLIVSLGIFKAIQAYFVTLSGNQQKSFTLWSWEKLPCNQLVKKNSSGKNFPRSGFTAKISLISESVFLKMGQTQGSVQENLRYWPGLRSRRLGVIWVKKGTGHATGTCSFLTTYEFQALATKAKILVARCRDFFFISFTEFSFFAVNYQGLLLQFQIDPPPPRKF